MFHYSTTAFDGQLEALLAQYRLRQRPITLDFRNLVKCLSSADRATHLLHPYPAKLLMHIPFFFLANSILSKPGDQVLDPFCGSGTVLLESQLAGRVALGADSNPLARLLSRVKTTPLNSAELRSAVAELLERIPSQPTSELPDVVNLTYWFYPHVIKQLHCISDAISQTQNSRIGDFFRVCFSNCVRKVSLADPRISVPVRLRNDQYPPNHPLRRKTAAHLHQLRRINVMTAFKEILDLNSLRLATLDLLPLSAPQPHIIYPDARNLTFEYDSARCDGQPLPNNSVQLIITSPPYPGAQKYIRSSSLSLGWLRFCSAPQIRAYKGLNIGREEFAKSEYTARASVGIAEADFRLAEIRAVNPIRATIAAVYLTEMKDALKEMYRVLRPNGYLVLVAAENTFCSKKFKTQDYLRVIAEDLKLDTILRIVNEIRSRGLMTKRNHTAGMIAREWVLLFHKRR